MAAALGLLEMEASAQAKIQALIDESSNGTIHSPVAKSSVNSSFPVVVDPNPNLKKRGRKKKLTEDPPKIRRPKGRPPRNPGLPTSSATPGNPVRSLVCSIMDGNGRCRLPAGNRSVTEKLQEMIRVTGLNICVDARARHKRICREHSASLMLAMKQNSKAKQGQASLAGNQDGEGLSELDFARLPLSSLQRYKKHFKLRGLSTATKIELCQSVLCHFKRIPVSDDKQIFQDFFRKLKER